MNNKTLFLLILLVLVSGKVFAQIDSLKIDSLAKSIELDEVIVAANKKIVERKIDRLVFNVENTTLAAGLDAYELLKITPNIRVNNDLVTMTGKDKVSIMVNDKLIQLSNQELISYLKSISNTDIKKIEVITVPPSKYDAEGNSGLINIVLKRVATDYWKTTIRSTFGVASFPSFNNGIGFSYKKDKFLLQSSIDYNTGSWLKTNINTYNYTDRNWIDHSEAKEKYNTLGGRFVFEYNLSKKTSLGVQYFLNNSSPRVRDTNNSDIIYDDVTKNFNMQTKGNSKTENISHSLNVYSVYQIDSLGKKISFDADYFYYDNELNRDFYTNQIFKTTNSLFSAMNKGAQDVNNFSIKTDIEIPLKIVNLSFGGKASWIKTDNNVNFYNTTSGIPILDLTQSDEFQYKENVQAVYFSVNKEIGKRWEAQIGLRYESTITEGNSYSLNQINSNKYAKIFPTAYIVYTSDNNLSFNLNYSKRLSRPPYSRMNPFKWYNSAFSFNQGNPFLQPSFTDNFGLDFNYRGKWNISLFFSNTKDGYEYVTILDNSNNIRETKPFNYYNTKSFGLSQSCNIDFSKRISVYSSINVFYSDSKSTLPITNQSLHGWGGDFSINCDYSINNSKTIIFNTRFVNIFKGVWDLDRNNSYSQLDTSLKFLFFDKNLQITLAGTDLLKTYKQEFISYTNDIQINYKSYMDKRAFRISLIYNFGNQKISYNKSTGNEDEKNRAR